MRTTFGLVALSIIVLTTPAIAQQSDKITAAERTADREKAKQLYDQQYQRDAQEAERVNKANLSWLADHEMYKARKAAEHDAAMREWRKDVARQKADYEAEVATCIAEKRCSPQ